VNSERQSSVFVSSHRSAVTVSRSLACTAFDWSQCAIQRQQTVPGAVQDALAETQHRLGRDSTNSGVRPAQVGKTWTRRMGRSSSAATFAV
jgi:hypothetical protein